MPRKTPDNYPGSIPSKLDGSDVRQQVYGLNFLWTEWTLMPNASKSKKNPVPTRNSTKHANPSVHFCHFLAFSPLINYVFIPSFNNSFMSESVRFNCKPGYISCDLL